MFEKIIFLAVLVSSVGAFAGDECVADEKSEVVENMKPLTCLAVLSELEKSKGCLETGDVGCLGRLFKFPPFQGKMELQSAEVSWKKENEEAKELKPTIVLKIAHGASYGAVGLCNLTTGNEEPKKIKSITNPDRPGSL